MPTTVKGQAEVKRFITRLPDDLEKVLRGAARAGAKIVADEIKEQTPSEAVRDNVRIRSQRGDGQIVVKIDVKPGWARSVGIWLEYGTSPHFISVDDSQRQGMSVGRINKQAAEGDRSHSLIVGGKFVGATVFHPGARAHPTFRPALDLKEAEAIAAARGYINSHVKPSGIVAPADAGGDEE
jgi:hypothetical protein